MWCARREIQEIQESPEATISCDFKFGERFRHCPDLGTYDFGCPRTAYFPLQIFEVCHFCFAARKTMVAIECWPSLGLPLAHAEVVPAYGWLERNEWLYTDLVKVAYYSS